jgi:hypothetical protein
MRIVIVGIGMIGSRHAACFQRAGHDIVTVDSGGGADFDRVARVPGPSSVDAWVVATPTGTHLGVVEQILRGQPDARILLEKPACYPSQLADFTRIIHRFPRSRIVVNDVYAYSEAVRRFAASVRGSSTFDQVAKITVEFTKNRELDVANGRFVDTQYGEAGYELFHMLSILRAVLPADLYRSYLRAEPVLATPELRVRTSAARLPQIDLYTSSSGLIGFAGLAAFAFPATAAWHYISRSRIPHGADLRFRFADVELSSGRHVTLVFEPGYGTDTDYKNTHAVHIRDAVSRHRFLVTGNHFEGALLRQLDLLRHAREGTAVVRLAEHRYLAAIGAASIGGFALQNGQRQIAEKLTKNVDEMKVRHDAK